MRNQNVIRAATLAALTTIALAPFTARAQPAPTASPEEVAALREQIRLLDQKLRILERNLEIKDETAAAEAKKHPVVAVGDRGLSVTSGDKRFNVRVGALLQADFRHFGNDDADTGRDGFLFRRVRPTIQGTVNEKFGFRLTPEFAGSNFQLLDATVSYTHNPALVLTAGKFKAPFDLERLQSGAAITFIERAYPTTLGPNREIGVQLSGALAESRLNYAVALGNGVPDGANSVTNIDDDLEVSARLFATPFVKQEASALAGLGFGVAATYGDKTLGAPSGYVSNGQQTIYSWAANTVASGKHLRLSPQATYYYGPFGLLGSYVVSKQELERAGNYDTLSHKGWLAQASYVLTGEKASFSGVTPARPFQPSAGAWGAFEVAFRVSGIDFDDDAFVGPAATRFSNPAASVTDATSYGVGLNWYLNRNIKTAFNYEKTVFTGGGGAADVDRPDEHAFFARVQLNF
jgi:phosphate-selective porin OprO/OprP